jgi:hypothetical protein
MQNTEVRGQEIGTNGDRPVVVLVREFRRRNCDPTRTSSGNQACRLKPAFGRKATATSLDQSETSLAWPSNGGPVANAHESEIGKWVLGQCLVAVAAMRPSIGYNGSLYPGVEA